MLSAENIILTLKFAVIAVTVLLLASQIALLRGNYRLHGRINWIFFVLTMTALLGLEVIAQVLSPGMFSEYFTRKDAWHELVLHLCFALPAAVSLPLMLYTGARHKRRTHIALAVLFSIFWSGTFVTGVFFLPHE